MMSIARIILTDLIAPIESD